MSVRKADAPLILDLPKPMADQPSWVKVGAIAAVGFVLGVAWPKLTGVRLGPAAPGESAPASSAPPRALDAPPVAPVAPAAPPTIPATSVASAAPSAAAPVVTSGPPAVAVRPGVTLSCKTNEGESLKGKACGAFAFDSLALPRLKKLSQCQAADGAEGKLSTVFNVDFANNKVDVFVGRSSTIGNLDTIAGCLRQSLQNVSLAPLEHEHARYQVAYSVQLSTKAPSATAGGATPGTAPQAGKEETAAGDAQVVWEVAIVRDTPRTGQVVARLQRGTKIRVGSTQEGWYRVKYGATFNDEGWVYRGAIGK